MNPVPVERKPGRASRGPGLAVAVAGALVASGLGGLALNQVMAAGRSASGSSSTETFTVAGAIPAAAAASGLSGPAAPVLGPVAASGLAQPRLARMAAPPDPFQPPAGFVPAEKRLVSVPSEQPEGQDAAAVKPQPASISKAAPKVAPAPENGVPADAPKPEELAIVGLVQGDPPLAVVEYAGQQFYLKVGDQVADTWRLEEIKERSATFRLGGQRVEVPINGGRSQ